MAGVKKKVFHLYHLMRRLARGEELSSKDEYLAEELGVNERTLRRYLKEIYELYPDIVVTEKKPIYRGGRRVTVYRVVDPRKDVSEVLRFFLENDNDLSWVFQLLHEQDPTLLEEAGEAKEAIEKTLQKDKDVFLFNSKPFEMMETKRQQRIFGNLRDAVRLREYRNIDYDYNGLERYKDVKCLKIVFSQNNWYLAGETKEGHFKWFRISFVDNVSYSKKNGYQKKELEKYVEFFRRFEGPMTLYGVEPKRARLKAHPYVARYFREEMKPFFKSQTFVREEEDGSVEFTMDYTQPLEILPFVKNWSPGLEILEPRELIDEYVKELEASLARYGKRRK